MLEKYIKSKRGRFVVRRIIRSIPVILLASIVVFSMMHVSADTPDSVARRMLGPVGTQEQINEFIAEHHLRDPVYEQYFIWMEGILKGDWGTSIRYQQPVTEILIDRIPLTLQLMGAALIFSIVLGVTMGVIGALKHNTFIDYIVTVQALFWRSIPSFWLGVMFLLIFALRMGLFPIGGYDGFEYLILPALVLGLRLQAIIARLTRSSMLNVLNKDYIKTAKTKGLSNHIVIVKHGLRNALIPVVTVIALRLPWLFSGAMITESVFSLPGMGRLIVEGVNMLDFPVIQGAVLLISVTAVIANLLADIAYTYVDPRIDIEGKGGR